MYCIGIHKLVLSNSNQILMVVFAHRAYLESVCMCPSCADLDQLSVGFGEIEPGRASWRTTIELRYLYDRRLKINEISIASKHKPKSPMFRPYPRIVLRTITRLVNPLSIE